MGTPMSPSLFIPFWQDQRQLWPAHAERAHDPAQPLSTCSERALKVRGYLRPCPWVTSSDLAASEPLDPTILMGGGEGLSNQLCVLREMFTSCLPICMKVVDAPQGAFQVCHSISHESIAAKTC